MKMVLKMSFLSLNNIDIQFTKLRTLTWRVYTIVGALSTTK